MSKSTKDREPVASPDAMSAALEAEQRALDSIKACEQRAAELVDSARQRSRAIAQRTDRRITALHAQRMGTLTEKIDIMLREDAARASEATQVSLERKVLQLAVESVAARLTGETKK